MISKFLLFRALSLWCLWWQPKLTKPLQSWTDDGDAYNDITASSSCTSDVMVTLFWVWLEYIWYLKDQWKGDKYYFWYRPREGVRVDVAFCIVRSSWFKKQLFSVDMKWGYRAWQRPDTKAAFESWEHETSYSWKSLCSEFTSKSQLTKLCWEMTFNHFHYFCLHFPSRL